MRPLGNYVAVRGKLKSRPKYTYKLSTALAGVFVSVGVVVQLRAPVEELLDEHVRTPAHRADVVKCLLTVKHEDKVRMRFPFR